MHAERVSRTLSKTSERGARVSFKTHEHELSLHGLHNMASVAKYDRIIQDAILNYVSESLKLPCFYHHDQISMTIFYNIRHNSKKNQMALSSSI